jgi:hypothetical protein
MRRQAGTIDGALGERQCGSGLCGGVYNGSVRVASMT